MIFATGDTHGNFQRFASEHFPEQKNMSRSDYVIICGDFGGVWDGSSRESYWLDWLNDKPFTTLFVCGNHENFGMLGALPEKDWHGGRVHQVRENILHLMRGQLYEIDGYTFFTMGGAKSHDIKDGILDPDAPDFHNKYRQYVNQDRQFRIKGRSWWPEEMPSDAEYCTALSVLEKANWEVDYVITHSAPSGLLPMMDRHYQSDQITDFLDMVSKKLRFHYWLFGHYHDNRNIGQNYVLLWEQMVQVV